MYIFKVAGEPRVLYSPYRSVLDIDLGGGGVEWGQNDVTLFLLIWYLAGELRLAKMVSSGVCVVIPGEGMLKEGSLQRGENAGCLQSEWL